MCNACVEDNAESAGMRCWDETSQSFTLALLCVTFVVDLGLRLFKHRSCHHCHVIATHQRTRKASLVTAHDRHESATKSLSLSKRSNPTSAVIGHGESKEDGLKGNRSTRGEGEVLGRDVGDVSLLVDPLDDAGDHLAGPDFVGLFEPFLQQGLDGCFPLDRRCDLSQLGTVHTGNVAFIISVRKTTRCNAR